MTKLYIPPVQPELVPRRHLIERRTRGCGASYLHLHSSRIWQDDMAERVVQYSALLIAFLIAFNTTRSNVDERRRDLATMFAFGTPVRTVIRMAMVENLIIGVLGTAVGVGLGWLMLSSILLERTEAMQPDLDVIISVAPITLGWAVLIGVVAVTLTPLFMARRLTKMDISTTLRVVE